VDGESGKNNNRGDAFFVRHFLAQREGLGLVVLDFQRPYLLIFREQFYLFTKTVKKWMGKA
jgi:hypothetical protein